MAKTAKSSTKAQPKKKAAAKSKPARAKTPTKRGARKK
jgi:hypothetical protein